MFREMMIGRFKPVIPILVLCVGAAVSAAEQPSGSARQDSKLTLESSDSRLNAAFTWAKRQALAYAFSGDPVGPWYEAALPGREAFCMRDVAHQSMGAQALGLAPYTANMLHRFAENISNSKDWCSYWEIDRYNRPAPVDYKNDAAFWYCLPANYDVLDACYRMFLWTGDLAYVNDPVFLNFYDRTVTDYEQRWDLDLPHAMRRKRWTNVRGEFDNSKSFQFFRGNPSYEENREDFVLGIDLLATQYAGHLAYAAIQDVRRNDPLAQTYREKAAAVKALVQNSWWDAKDGRFYARLNKDYGFEGQATSALLYRDIVDDKTKLTSTLDAFLNQIKEKPSSSVEGQSHHAEILYRYGVPDVAYMQMIDLAREDRERREYPEVSYSLIGAIVTGLMGITLDAMPFSSSDRGNFVDHIIRTQPGLGSKVAWAELGNLPIHANEIRVRHEGVQTTIFTNQTGPSVIWRASFAGSFTNLLLNGRTARAHVTQDRMGRNVSWIDVPVAPGVTVRVEAGRAIVPKETN